MTDTTHKSIDVEPPKIGQRNPSLEARLEQIQGTLDEVKDYVALRQEVRELTKRVEALEARAK